MSLDIIIRNGRIKDRNQVVKIWKEFMDYHIEISDMFEDGVVDEAPELWMRFFEAHVRSRIRNALVAEKEGMVVGYLLASITKRPPIFNERSQVFITDIAVKKEYQNMGAGTKLMDTIASWASEKGIKILSLNVVPENKIGMNFWNKQGFRTMFLSRRKKL